MREVCFVSHLHELAGVGCALLVGTACVDATPGYVEMGGAPTPLAPCRLGTVNSGDIALPQVAADGEGRAWLAMELRETEETMPCVEEAAGPHAAGSQERVQHGVAARDEVRSLVLTWTDDHGLSFRVLQRLSDGHADVLCLPMDVLVEGETVVVLAEIYPVGSLPSPFLRVYRSDDRGDSWLDVVDFGGPQRVHGWSNRGRLVLDDGEVVVVALTWAGPEEEILWSSTANGDVRIISDGDLEALLDDHAMDLVRRGEDVIGLVQGQMQPSKEVHMYLVGAYPPSPPVALGLTPAELAAGDASVQAEVRGATDGEGLLVRSIGSSEEQVGCRWTLIGSTSSPDADLESWLMGAPGDFGCGRAGGQIGYAAGGYWSASMQGEGVFEPVLGYNLDWEIERLHAPSRQFVESVLAGEMPLFAYSLYGIDVDEEGGVHILEGHLGYYYYVQTSCCAVRPF